MKFSALVAIVPEDLEQECIDAARDCGAGGITVMSGRGISNTAKKTFFGLTYDGSQSVLLMVLEKGLSLDVLKAVQKVIMPDAKDSQGMIFTVPLEHLGGIDMAQVEKFEQHLKDSLYPERRQ
ncbi:MAG: transcriptional regulator [Pseudomonadota bacterium]|nr:transcriptional regulator [Pseudomonadota bacterium]